MPTDAPGEPISPQPTPPSELSSTPARGVEAMFLVGAATMIFELIWIRQWGRVIGSDATGVAITLGSFLVGSGLGCLLGARSRWSPRHWLIGATVAALCCSILGEWALPRWSSGWALVGTMPIQLLVSLPIALTALFLAAAIPAWFRQRMTTGSEPGDDPGTVYRRAGIWTAALDVGSALGALATPLFLLPRLGAIGTIGAGLVCVAAALALSRTGNVNAPDTDSVRARSERSAASKSRYILAFLVGAIGFGLQIVWVRLLGEILGTSVLILGCAAAASLIGGGIGCRALPWLARRFSPERIVSMLWVGWIATQGASALTLAWLPELYLRFAESAGATGSVTSLKVLLVTGALVPPALLSGFVLPTLAAGWSASVEELGHETGSTQGAGFFGGGIGALLAGSIGIPIAGSGGTLLALALATLASLPVVIAVVRNRRAALESDGSRSEPSRRFRAIALVLIAIGVGSGGLAISKWDDHLLGAGVFQWSRQDVAGGNALANWRQREVLYSGEGRLARVSIERVEATNTSFLRVGGRVEGSVPIREGEPSNADLPTEILLGVLPALERGTGSETLVIGVGGGTTVATVVEATQGSVTALEVEGEVLAALRSSAGRECFPWDTQRLFEGSPLRGAEVGGPQPATLIVEDARAYLHRESRLWDAIVCQPSEPWLPWSAPLFTTDFYELVASRLAPGGAAIHWVQLYRIQIQEFAAIVAAFCEAFPRVRIFYPPQTGEVILVGGGEAVPRATWQQRWDAPGLLACRKRVGWGSTPPSPILAGEALFAWLEARGVDGRGEMQAQLEFRLPLVGDRGEDQSGAILASLRNAGSAQGSAERGQ